MWVIPRQPTRVKYKRDVEALNELAIGGVQKWGKDEWTPERIIPDYSPASWNPHEHILGARGPSNSAHHGKLYSKKLALSGTTA